MGDIAAGERGVIAAIARDGVAGCIIGFLDPESVEPELGSFGLLLSLDESSALLSSLLEAESSGSLAGAVSDCAGFG